MTKERSPLRKYLKPYKKEVIISPLFKLLEALFDLFVPIVVARMINSTISSSNNSLLFYFIILIAMAFLGLLCSVIAQYFASQASVGFASQLR